MTRLQPEPRPMVSTRLDLPRLASLALYLSKGNGRVETRSSLVRIALERYIDDLQKRGLAERVESVDEALLILTTLDLAPTTHQRNRRALLQASALEGGGEERMDTEERITLLSLEAESKRKAGG